MTLAKGGSVKGCQALFLVAPPRQVGLGLARIDYAFVPLLDERAGGAPMVQVDVFWSYGLASGLTLAAGQKLKKVPRWNNPYFLGILLWTTLIFAPSGVYLLWSFPYWETMFVAVNHSSIPAWLVTLFCVTNVTQAILGYLLTRHFILADKPGAAISQTIWSHGAMLFLLVFGWDSTGFKRFTYSGNGEDWVKGVDLPWTQFFTSPVFFALLGMSVFFIPTYFGLIKKFRSTN
jgi:hypothetical protein